MVVGLDVERFEVVFSFSFVNFDTVDTCVSSEDGVVAKVRMSGSITSRNKDSIDPFELTPASNNLFNKIGNSMESKAF